MSAPVRKADPARLFELFREVGILEHLSRAVFEARLPDGLLVSQFSVVNHLIRVQDGRTPLDLARIFQVPKTTMTHTLAVLERHAFVETRPNPSDGRSKCVFVTEGGRAFHEDAIARLGPDLVSLQDVLSAEELETALPILQKLREHLDAARD